MQALLELHLDRGRIYTANGIKLGSFVPGASLELFKEAAVPAREMRELTAIIAPGLLEGLAG